MQYAEIYAEGCGFWEGSAERIEGYGTSFELVS
jgi:hypothetical protein